ncbi:ribonuclease [Sphingomonas sp. GlSt437]|uniref:ribonuclease n=1 Tax=Sphingomonas sp. GlSt437 TaxID=3389970 RepID=UPI003A87B494
MSQRWLVEDGIGEQRAALVIDGRIIKARIEPDDAGPLVGAVLDAVLTEGGRLPKVTLASGGEAMLDRMPQGMTLGQRLRVEVVRMALSEGPRRKLPKVVVATEGAALRPGATLIERVAASGVPVERVTAHGPDLLEEAGWSEVLEEAASGDIAFPGGVLRLAITPAMALFDVDGDGAAEALAVAAAKAVGEAVIRLGIGGSIGIDFPTLAGKGARQAVAAALDAALAEAGPFERTAVNGFGFLQLIRPRSRPSLPEHVRGPGAAARALLRRWERELPPGPSVRPAPAPVARWLNDQRPDLLAALARRTGNAAPVTDMGLSYTHR